MGELDWCGSLVGLEDRAEQTSPDLGVEDSEAYAFGGAAR